MKNISSADIIALIPAAGVGKRMKTICPKQYLTIGKFTIFEHSLSCLLVHPEIKKVIVALNIHDQWFNQLSLAKDPRVLRVNGGNTRAESVLAGLHVIHKFTNNWVLVHDAVRPCLHLEDLTRLLLMRNYTKVGAILAYPVRDTIKLVKPGETKISCTIEREDLWHALTPQFFPCSFLINCLTRALEEGIAINDESSAVEYCGYHPELVSGRSDNIKITTQEDLLFANFILSRLNKEE